MLIYLHLFFYEPSLFVLDQVSVWNYILSTHSTSCGVFNLQ